jgi:D-sedoheptulose 7-phosphate isomerase
MQEIQRRLRESAELKLRLGAAELEPLARLIDATTAALAAGHKMLVCGNGGSAADAQHIAAELVGRYQKERRGLPAIALTTDTSILTSIGNDYGFDAVFARQVEALAVAGDVLIGISTSGNSPNVEKAIVRARELGGIVTAAFLGRDGGRIKHLVDHAIVVPGTDTARIQECHITFGHILCELVEARLVDEMRQQRS